jgi:predicted nucleic acid-binding Zn ribbon protein
MSEDSMPRQLCLVCGVRGAEPMTYVCEDEKCFEIFMDYQSKGRLKELLSGWEGEKKEEKEEYAH